MKLKSNLKADGALLLTAIIWGSTFPVSKDILELWPPVSYLALRMIGATLLLAAIFHRRLLATSRAEWRAGAALGAIMGVSVCAVIIGQVYTTAAKSAFITSLTTPLVPFVAFVLVRARPNAENLAGVVLASLGGVLILAPQGASVFNAGDVITLCCTLLFATHMTLLSVYARRHDVGSLTVVQITTAAALISLFWLALQISGGFIDAKTLPEAFAREFEPLVWSAPFVWRLLYTIVVATVLNYLIWTWAQARMSATHAAIILSLEPVFATIFAVLMRGSDEWTGGRANFGALLILAGVVVSELRWSERKGGLEELREGGAGEA